MKHVITFEAVGRQDDTALIAEAINGAVLVTLGEDGYTLRVSGQDDDYEIAAQVEGRRVLIRARTGFEED